MRRTTGSRMLAAILRELANFWSSSSKAGISFTKNLTLKVLMARKYLLTSCWVCRPTKEQRIDKMSTAF